MRAGGTLTIAGAMIASGGDGGSLDLGSVDALAVGVNAALRAAATAPAGSGGDIGLASTASSPSTVINANGRNGNADDGGGDGGLIALAGAEVRAERAAGRIVASAAGSPRRPRRGDRDLDQQRPAGPARPRRRVVARWRWRRRQRQPRRHRSPGVRVGRRVRRQRRRRDRRDQQRHAGRRRLRHARCRQRQWRRRQRRSRRRRPAGAQGDLDADGGGEQGGAGGDLLLTACTVEIAAGAERPALPAGRSAARRSSAATPPSPAPLRADVATGRNQAR
ncbi:MAG: hypothetical protein U0802_24675 [Candidatus Binatia bacterium]